MSQKCYAPTIIQCNNCNWSTPVAGALVKEEKDIMALATTIHSKTGIVCATPLLVVLWTHAIVSNELYRQLFKIKVDEKNNNSNNGLIVKGNG